MIYIIGDIHGHCNKLIALLINHGLISTDLSWSGGRHELWFTGDFVDRGPDGIAALDLVMRLQREAAATGGKVGAVLGNHDMLLLAAQRFGDRNPPGTNINFMDNWLINGGNPVDLAMLTQFHMDWLAALPAMAHVGEHLLIHADAFFYRDFGVTTGDVNRQFTRTIAGHDAHAWRRMLRMFSEREAFYEPRGGAPDRARGLLAAFGGQRLIHGHTPISAMTGAEPYTVTEPLIYGDSLVVNVDAGLYLGSTGFVYSLDSA